VPKEILIPGRPGRDERVRASWLGRDPAPVDVPVARRLGVLAVSVRCADMRCWGSGVGGGLADAVSTPSDARTIGQRRTDVLCAFFQSVLDRGGWSGTCLPVQHGGRPHVEVLIPHHVLDSARRSGAGTANVGVDHGVPRPADVCEL